MQEESPDGSGITETWLKPDIRDCEINVGSYNGFRKDRLDRVGGGVVLLVKNSITALLRDDVQNIGFEESVWCEVGTAKEKTLFGLCYRKPADDKLNDDKLFRLFNEACSETVVIMGDFNFGDEINWLTGESKGQGQSFLECCNENFLGQCVEYPTRQNNVLDLVLSNECEMIQNLVVGEQFSSSDHQSIRFEIVTKQADLKFISEKFYDYFGANYEEIRALATK